MFQFHGGGSSGAGVDKGNIGEDIKVVGRGLRTISPNISLVGMAILYLCHINNHTFFFFSAQNADLFKG